MSQIHFISALTSLSAGSTSSPHLSSLRRLPSHSSTARKTRASSCTVMSSCMPNHVHSIVSASQGNLSSIIRDYKRHTSWRISELLGETRNRRLLKYFRSVARREERGNDHKIWQSGSHPILIESGEFFDQKLEYIHHNPVVKGYVERPEYWKFSSARNYFLNDHSVIKIDILE